MNAEERAAWILERLVMYRDRRGRTKIDTVLWEQDVSFMQRAMKYSEEEWDRIAAGEARLKEVYAEMLRETHAEQAAMVEPPKGDK